jgi:DNA (cytosine-5)-methyltransferase 1
VDIELFTGAGGLSLGLAAAGFGPDHLFERNPRCCVTLKMNKKGDFGISGEVHEGDVRAVDWSEIQMPVRLLAAGPPCQPFSLAGNHLGDSDARNEFPATLRAIRELQPAVVLIENVQGLARPSFRKYLDYILRQLAFPSCALKDTHESWSEHDSRLSRKVEAGDTPEYAVHYGVLNAADYGVAQIRNRTVMIATRKDLPAVNLPPKTHSRDALIAEQESGAYWKRHGMRPPEIQKRELDLGQAALKLQPWRTVRDALLGLRTPSEKSDDPIQHWLIPGARIYRGHRGSTFDWPSKTIKAGVHGVAGGENILHLDDGSFRYFTIREMARIQGFPDSYIFHGPRSRVIGQIGNAVPCGLAEALGLHIRKVLLQSCVTNDKIDSIPRQHHGVLHHAG